MIYDIKLGPMCEIGMGGHEVGDLRINGVVVCQVASAYVAIDHAYIIDPEHGYVVCLDVPTPLDFSIDFTIVRLSDFATKRAGKKLDYGEMLPEQSRFPVIRYQAFGAVRSAPPQPLDIDLSEYLTNDGWTPRRTSQPRDRQDVS